MLPKAQPGHFRLLYFASAASFIRKDSDVFPAPLPVRDLFSFLENKYPGITKAVLLSSAVTINLDYVDIDEDKHKQIQSDLEVITIKAGDEVAIIPPVSSG